MPWTYANAAEAINHVMYSVFQVTKDELLYKALEKSEDNNIRNMVLPRDADMTP